MVLRRSDGSVIFAACRCIFNCNDALEDELHARMQGMALAIEHGETDSSEAFMALRGDNLRYSAYGHLVAEIQRHMGVREFIPSKIKREQNRVADRLALYSRRESTTAVWLGRGPPCVEELLPLDCNLVILE
ncbi:unnamed protein product [Triticum turgidum subsp. durum]|uniref:RNase H type-1 domain-containing protein n=1 Tax=Triticum turgidum subsp. durum TaxID=4567 RepID=A0A9R0V929_TRITD|nr:unnamed protein product [Triticum turgidum subsp. durum]